MMELAGDTGCTGACGVVAINTLWEDEGDR
jgi:hypothetical protein